VVAVGLVSPLASRANPQQGAGVATQHNERRRGGQMTLRLFRGRLPVFAKSFHLDCQTGLKVVQMPNLILASIWLGQTL
jgi:hypothetical protein